MTASHALALLADAPLGTRLVVRYHEGSGAADALGYLRQRSTTGLVIETRRGEQRVALSRHRRPARARTTGAASAPELIRSGPKTSIPRVK